VTGKEKKETGFFPRAGRGGTTGAVKKGGRGGKKKERRSEMDPKYSILKKGCKGPGGGKEGRKRRRPRHHQPFMFWGGTRARKGEKKGGKGKRERRIASHTTYLLSGS